MLLSCRTVLRQTAEGNHEVNLHQSLKVCHIKKSLKHVCTCHRSCVLQMFHLLDHGSISATWTTKSESRRMPCSSCRFPSQSFPRCTAAFLDAAINNPQITALVFDLLHFVFLWTTKFLSYVCEDLLHCSRHCLAILPNCGGSEQTWTTGNLFRSRNRFLRAGVRVSICVPHLRVCMHYCGTWSPVTVSVYRDGCRYFGRLWQRRTGAGLVFGHLPVIRQRAPSCLLSTRLPPASRASLEWPSETVTVHASTLGTRPAVSLSFARGGRLPKVRVPSVDTLFPRGLNTRTDWLTVTRLPVSRMLRTIWPSLHRMCRSTQNSQKRAHRWSVAVCFLTPYRANIEPPLFGPSGPCYEQTEPRASCALERGARACLFLRGAILTVVERVWHS